MKTKLTKELEQYVFEKYEFGKKGIYGCCEVKVGVGIYETTEIVDYLIYDRNTNEYKAFEIKSSIADIKSKHKLSFVGHKNYLVTTEDVYEKAMAMNLIPFNCGIILLGKGVISKSSKKTLSMSQQIMLLESLMRSLHREVNKNRITKEIVNIIEETFPNSKGIRSTSKHVKAMYEIIKLLNINSVDHNLMDGMSALDKLHNKYRGNNQ